MKWKYFFEDGSVIIFSKSLTPYREKIYIKAHGRVLHIELIRSNDEG